MHSRYARLNVHRTFQIEWETSILTYEWEEASAGTEAGGPAAVSIEADAESGCRGSGEGGREAGWRRGRRRSGRMFPSYGEGGVEAGAEQRPWGSSAAEAAEKAGARRRVARGPVVEAAAMAQGVPAVAETRRGQ